MDENIPDAVPKTPAQSTTKLPVKERFRNIVARTRKHYTELPEKKRYFEFFSAILTIPVLITVLILNGSTLLGNKTTPTPTPAVIIATPTATNPEVSPTDSPVCRKEIGPISISTPEEGENVQENPVCVTIEYAKGDYCSVVWSYRINGGKWSEYDDNSVCLYDVPKGKVNFELRVKSIVAEGTKTIKRTFTYQPTITPTTPVASDSAQ